jgi:D-alanyl-D-alanine dipeptidase
MTSDSWRIIPHLFLGFGLAACASEGGTRSAFVPAHSIELAKHCGLIEVRRVIPDAVIDLRYATPDNVAKRPLYPARMPCLLRIETAEKLKTAQTLLRAQGYGLRIWDAYRPPEAQETLHSHAGSTGMFLSPEATGWSRHCGGIAVDLTLVDAHGNVLRMPTGFDQDLANASRHYRGNDPVVKQNLQILQAAMQRAGFIQLESEWWHFDDKDYLHDPQQIVYARQLAIPLP